MNPVATATNAKLVYRQPDILTVLGISKTTLWRMIESNQFPKPFKLGRLNGWKVETINEWLKGV
jgi:predicted DNA-binding transcriptional regulator AlpA